MQETNLEEKDAKGDDEEFMRRWQEACGGFHVEEVLHLEEVARCSCMEILRWTQVTPPLRS